MTMTQVRRWIFPRLRGLHKTRLKTISALVWGCLNAAALGVAAIGRGIAGRTSPRHSIKRVWRFFRNHRIKTEAVMAMLVRQAESFGGMLAVALDWVELRNRQRALVAGLCRNDGRAFPLSWTVVWNSRFEVSQNEVENAFLAQLAALFSDPSRVVIVADRGFRRASLLALLERLKFHYVIRICENVKVDGPRFSGILGRHELREGGEDDLGWVDYREDGIIRTRIVARWARGAEEPWYLATSGEKTIKRVCEIYALRMEIEEFLRDLKSHRYGAALRYTLLSEPDRYARLLAIWALGVWLLVAQGLAAIRRNLHLGLSSAPHSRTDLSYIGAGQPCHSPSKDGGMKKVGMDQRASRLTAHGGRLDSRFRQRGREERCDRGQDDGEAPPGALDRQRDGRDERQLGDHVADRAQRRDRP